MTGNDESERMLKDEVPGYVQLSTLARSNKHLVLNSDSTHVPAEFRLLNTLIANLWKKI